MLSLSASVKATTKPNFKKWKKITIHHSAGSTGSTIIFDRQHKAKGWKGIGYHFVICNGTSGKKDGLIEMTFRWLEQIPGAHVKSQNTANIGICLVGNFEKSKPTKEQMKSLRWLLDALMKLCDIKVENIKGHKDQRQTKCPGKNLNVSKIVKSLRKSTSQPTTKPRS